MHIFDPSFDHNPHDLFSLPTVSYYSEIYYIVLKSRYVTRCEYYSVLDILYETVPSTVCQFCCKATLIPLW